MAQRSSTSAVRGRIPQPQVVLHGLHMGTALAGVTWLHMTLTFHA